MPVTPGLRAFFAKLASNRMVRKTIAKNVRVGYKGAARGYRRIENTFRPRISNPDRLGKLAFRTDIATSALGVGLVGYGAKAQYDDVKHMKRSQKEREAALRKFKQGPSRRRVRRVGDR